MNLVSHGEIEKKIKGYIRNLDGIAVDVDPNERENQLAKLGVMFGNYFAMSGYLVEFKEIDLAGINIYYYDTVSVDKQKKTSYMAVCSEDKPLFLSTFTGAGNEDTKYSEESFSTYDKDTKRIISRVKNNLLIIGHSAELETIIMDSKDNEYYRKQYKFYYDIDRMVAYQIGEDKFFNINDSRLELAISRVEKVSDRVRNKLDEGLGINQDYVNEYKIKRKNMKEF